jgi:hypothetical protein
MEQQVRQALVSTLPSAGTAAELQLHPFAEPCMLLQYPINWAPSGFAMLYPGMLSRIGLHQHTLVTYLSAFLAASAAHLLPRSPLVRQQQLQPLLHMPR